MYFRSPSTTDPTETLRRSVPKISKCCGQRGDDSRGIDSSSLCRIHLLQKLDRPADHPSCQNRIERHAPWSVECGQQLDTQQEDCDEIQSSDRIVAVEFLVGSVSQLFQMVIDTQIRHFQYPAGLALALRSFF
ncbi:hypothetical protein DPSP01_001877 [Paraphaeosphaeria sporulosa]